MSQISTALTPPSGRSRTSLAQKPFPCERMARSECESGPYPGTSPKCVRGHFPPAWPVHQGALPSATSTLIPAWLPELPQPKTRDRGTDRQEIPAGICVLQEDPLSLQLITELVVARGDPAPAVKLSWFFSLLFIAMPGTESSN